MNNLGILLSGRGSNFEAIANNVAAGQNPRRSDCRRDLKQARRWRIETAKRLGLTTHSPSLPKVWRAKSTTANGRGSERTQS